MRKLRMAAMLLLCTAVFFLPGTALAAEPKLAVSEAYAGSVYYERLTAVELTGDWRTDIVNVALSQIGYHEGFSKADYGGGCADGWGNCTEYGAVYGGLDSQWCAMFVSWCARQAGIPTYAVNNAARAAIGKAGEETTRYMFHTNVMRPSYYTPNPGDLVFFTENGMHANHVGIVVRVTEEGLWSVEGNALNAVRLNFYPKDSKDVLYFGYYTVPGAVETAFSATRLEFVNSDGGFALLPDSSVERYSFEALYAVHGREFTLPAAPFEKEGALLAGYRVQRSEDGLWYCTDGAWHSAEAMSRSGTALYLMAPDGSRRAEGFLTEAATLRLYCVWSENGGLAEDSAVDSAMQRDGEGWCPFSDVTAGAWYYDSVRQAAFAGWLEETDAFRPSEAATRGELVTLLYRMQGSPAVTEPSAFPDTAGTALEAAAAWACAAGILQGDTDGLLHPEGLLTREQTVTLLYRLLGGGAAAEVPDYPDAAEVSDWARDAVGWGTAQSLMQGIPAEDGSLYLRPGQTLNRAEAVTLLQRIAAAENPEYKGLSDF